MLSASIGCRTKASSWVDPSKHTVHMVTVDQNVKLEVLDWGGTGRPIVLLAGSGLTAHVYDGFAEKLAGPYHVYGITRRGFGASSHAVTGYTAQRLADDVLQVLDSLRLAKPVLIGHSLAGEEITLLASEHPDRVAGLVYLEATRDPSRDYGPLRERASTAGVTGPSPSTDNMRSFAAYRAWQTSTFGFAFPESELRSTYASNPDGSMGAYGTSSGVFAAIQAGTKKPDYTKVRMPILAIVAIPATAEQEVARHYQFKNERERAAVEDNHRQILQYIRDDENSIQAVPGARVVEIRGADHYVFLSNENEVLRQIKVFLAQLP